MHTSKEPLKTRSKLFRENYLFIHKQVPASAKGIHCFAYFDSEFFPGFQRFNPPSPYAVYALITEGSYFSRQEDKSFVESRKGDFIISRFQSTPRELKMTGDTPCRRKCLLLHQTELHNAVVSHFFPSLKMKIPLHDISSVEKILDAIKAEFVNSGEVDEIKLSGLFLELLEKVNIQPEKSNYPEALNIALDFITSRLYDHRLCREDIADAAGVTVRTLTRLFRNYLDIRIMQYIMNRRLQRAADMLLLPNIRIKEIAESCGFGSSIYMARVFRKHFQKTPREYRRDWRPD